MDNLTFVNWILEKASVSNQVLALLALIIIINYFVSDPLPFIDELISTPVLIIILDRIVKGFGKYKGRNQIQDKTSK